MIVRLAKDYKYYEILFESQEEGTAVKDYLDQILTSGVVERAYWQHEQETSTDGDHNQPLFKEWLNGSR